MTQSQTDEVIPVLPVNLEKKDGWLFKPAKDWLTPSRQLVLRNVFIFWQGQIFRRGMVVEESLCTTFYLKKHSPIFFLTRLLKSIFRGRFFVLKHSPYVVVHDEWSVNYFHWLTDVLTRLYTIKDIINEYTLILPDTFRQSYHLYLLNKFGITNIEWTNDRRLLFAREVMMPTHTAPAGRYNSGLLREALRFLREGQATTINKGEKIFISRRKARFRNILNEEAVISFLQREGFAILIAEDLSFEEQLSIMSHAGILVSIHGAGLANLMFMPEGSCVLELRKENGPEQYNCYFELAAVFNHRYFYQGCQSDSDLSVSYADIYVDVEKLRSNLALM